MRRCYLAHKLNYNLLDYISPCGFHCSSQSPFVLFCPVPFLIRTQFAVRTCKLCRALSPNRILVWNRGVETTQFQTRNAIARNPPLPTAEFPSLTPASCTPLHFYQILLTVKMFHLRSICYVVFPTSLKFRIWSSGFLTGMCDTALNLKVGLKSAL